MGLTWYEFKNIVPTELGKMRCSGWLVESLSSQTVLITKMKVPTAGLSYATVSRFNYLFFKNVPKRNVRGATVRVMKWIRYVLKKSPDLSRFHSVSLLVFLKIQKPHMYFNYLERRWLSFMIATLPITTLSMAPSFLNSSGSKLEGSLCSRHVRTIRVSLP